MYGIAIFRRGANDAWYPGPQRDSRSGWWFTKLGLVIQLEHREEAFAKNQETDNLWHEIWLGPSANSCSTLVD